MPEFNNKLKGKRKERQSSYGRCSDSWESLNKGSWTLEIIKIKA